MTDFKYFESNMEQIVGWSAKLRDTHKDTLHLLHTETDPYKRSYYAKKIQKEKDRQLKHLGKYLFQGEKLYQSLMQVKDTNSRRMIQSTKNADKEESSAREKLKHKLTFGTTVYKDAEYSRKPYWSSQSVELEAMLKPNVVESVTLPDYRLFSSFQSNSQCGVVDSIFISQTSTIDGGRNSLERIWSKWNFSADNLVIDKCIVCKEEVENIVTELVLDFLPFSENATADDSIVQLKGPSSPRPAAVATTTKVSKRDKLANNGVFKTHAVLKAMLPDGRIHLRPLCTSGDVLLAVHELMDSETFVQGAVQFPFIIRGPNIGCNDEFVKYSFQLNSEPHWQLYKLRIPEKLQPLTPFICTSLCGSRELYDINDLNSKSIPSALLQLTKEITRQLCAFVGDENMLVSFSLDIEPFISYAGTVRDINRDHDQPLLSIPRLEFRLIQVSNVGYCRRYACFRRPAVASIINGTEKAYLQSFHKHFQVEFRKLKVGRGASIELDNDYEDYDIGCTDKIINAAKMKARKLAVTLWQRHLDAKEEESSSNNETESSDDDCNDGRGINDSVDKSNNIDVDDAMVGKDTIEVTSLNRSKESPQNPVQGNFSRTSKKNSVTFIDQESSTPLLSAYDEEELLPLRASSRRKKRNRNTLLGNIQPVNSDHENTELNNNDTPMRSVIFADEVKQSDVSDSVLDAGLITFPKLPVYPITSKPVQNNEVALENPKSANEKLIDDLLRFDEALNDIESSADSTLIENNGIDSFSGESNLSLLDRKFILAAQAVAQQLSIADIFIEDKVQTKLLNVIEGILLIQQNHGQISGANRLPPAEKMKKKGVVNVSLSMDDEDCDIDNSNAALNRFNGQDLAATNKLPSPILSTMLPNLRKGVMNIHVDDDVNGSPSNPFNARDYMDGIWRDLMKFIPAPLARTVKKKLAKIKKKKSIDSQNDKSKSEGVVVKIPVVVPAPVPEPPAVPRSSFMIPTRKYVEPPDFGDNRVTTGRMRILVRDVVPVEKDQYITVDQSAENLNGRKVYNRRMTKRLLNMMAFIIRKVDLSEALNPSTNTEESEEKKLLVSADDATPVVDSTVGKEEEPSGGVLWGKMLIEEDEENEDDEAHDDSSVMETDSHRYDIDSIYRKLSLGCLSQFEDSQDLSIVGGSLTSSSFVAEYIQMVVAEAKGNAEISIDNHRFYGMDIQEMLCSSYYRTDPATVPIIADRNDTTKPSISEHTKSKPSIKKKMLMSKVYAVMALTRGGQGAMKQRSSLSHDEAPPLRLGIKAETIKAPQSSLASITPTPPLPSTGRRLSVFDRQQTAVTTGATAKQPFTQQIFSPQEASATNSPFSLSDDILKSLPSYKIQSKIENHPVGRFKSETANRPQTVHAVNLPTQIPLDRDDNLPILITSTATAFIESLRLHEVVVKQTEARVVDEQRRRRVPDTIICTTTTLEQTEPHDDNHHYHQKEEDEDDDNMCVVDMNQISRYIEESTIASEDDSDSGTIDLKNLISDVRSASSLAYDQPRQTMAQSIVDNCFAKIQILQSVTSKMVAMDPESSMEHAHEQHQAPLEINIQLTEDENLRVDLATSDTLATMECVHVEATPASNNSQQLFPPEPATADKFTILDDVKSIGDDLSECLHYDVLETKQIANITASASHPVRPSTSLVLAPHPRDTIASRSHASRNSVMFDIDQFASFKDESMDVTIANSLDLEYRMRIGTAEIRIPHPPNTNKEINNDWDKALSNKRSFVRQGGGRIEINPKKDRKAKEQPSLKEFGFANISAFFDRQRVLAEQEHDTHMKEEKKPQVSKSITPVPHTSALAVGIGSTPISRSLTPPHITISRPTRPGCEPQMTSLVEIGKEEIPIIRPREKDSKRMQPSSSTEKWFPFIPQSVSGAPIPTALSTLAPGTNRVLSSNNTSHTNNNNNNNNNNSSSNKGRGKLARPGNIRSAIVPAPPNSLDFPLSKIGAENFQFFVASPIKPSHKNKIV